MAAPPLAKPEVEGRPAAYSVAAMPHAPVQDAPRAAVLPASAGLPPRAEHSRSSSIASSRVQSSIEGLRSHMGARPCKLRLPACAALLGTRRASANNPHPWVQVSFMLGRALTPVL